MQEYLRHMKACNNFDRAQFHPFYIEGKAIGWIEKPVASFFLEKAPDCLYQRDGALYLASDYKDFEQRSAVLDSLGRLACGFKGIRHRGELFPVAVDRDAPLLAQIDRGFVPLFGFLCFGVHMNGYVRKGDDFYIWVAKRDASKLIDPGKLDHVVAGGTPVGISLEDNLVKESYEEAGLSEDLVRKAVQATTLYYKCTFDTGLRNDAVVVFDLEMPEDVIPRNTDGEVESFTLMKAADVADLIRTSDAFKFNCSLVILDFLLRHHLLDETEASLKGLEKEMDFLRQPPLLLSDAA